MPRALLALGSNLGDRAQILDAACRALAASDQIHLLRQSDWHATQPIGGPSGQGEFLNGALLVNTSLSPAALHRQLKEIEDHAGRQPAAQWAARPLDLDLLLYEDLVIRSDQLEIPHPRMAFRRFVLEPAAQVAPTMKHPIIGWTIERLLDHLNSAAPYLAITGAEARTSTQLAEAVAAKLGGRYLADPAASLAPQNSPSPLLGNELELLRRRVPVLACTTWPATKMWSVSDFWLPQSLAYTDRSRISAEYWDKLTDEVSAAEAHAVPPKLLVLVDMAQAAVSTRSPASELADRLRELARRPDVGPLLTIESTAQISAQNQILAAVEAMQ